MPPIPGWDGLHPLIIHFPIALLLTVPVLLLLALIISRHAQGLTLAAFTLMLLGTVALLISVSTGEAAAEIAERTPGVNAVLEQHEELAEQVRIVFISLTVIFGLLLLAPVMLRRFYGRGVRMTGLLAMLILALVGDLLIVKTAHQGGRLVHEYGVHAIVASYGATSGANTVEPETDDD